MQGSCHVTAEQLCLAACRLLLARLVVDWLLQKLLRPDGAQAHSVWSCLAAVAAGTAFSQLVI